MHWLIENAFVDVIHGKRELDYRFLKEVVNGDLLIIDTFKKSLSIFDKKLKKLKVTFQFGNEIVRKLRGAPQFF